MNDIEVKINGEKVDIDPRAKIAANFQTNDIGDLSQMKADVTSTINLLDSARNHRIMKNAATLGSESSVQLGQVSASVLFRGIPLLSNGRAMIKGSKGGYAINIFGASFDFFEQIRDKKLSDFDWSAFDYTANAAHFQANYFNTSGLAFPICEYGKWTFYKFSVGSGKRFFINGLLPWMYLKTIISEIITQSGFTFTGDILSLPEYTESIIALRPPDDTPLFTEGQDVEVTVSDWMPDILATDFIKSVLYLYGAFISTID